VQSKFGKALPENIRIDAYEGPHGKGYQIYYEENGTAHSIGYAPEVADRTYTAEAEREEKGPFEKGNRECKRMQNPSHATRECLVAAGAPLSKSNFCNVPALTTHNRNFP
jgi:hypothetical protein